MSIFVAFPLCVRYSFRRPKGNGWKTKLVGFLGGKLSVFCIENRKSALIRECKTLFMISNERNIGIRDKLLNGYRKLMHLI